MLEITNLADQAVLLPVAATVGLLLALSGWRRGAVAWAAGIVCVFGLVFLSKLVLLHCGAGNALTMLSFRGPSGHTAGAGVVYGGLLGLGVSCATPSSRWTRRRSAWSTVAIAVPVVALVGLSRVALGLHSVADVVAGSVIGIAGAVAVVALAGPPRRLWGWAIGGAVLAAGGLAYGRQFPGEALIRSIAALVWSSPGCG